MLPLLEGVAVLEVSVELLDEDEGEEGAPPPPIPPGTNFCLFIADTIHHSSQATGQVSTSDSAATHDIKERHADMHIGVAHATRNIYD